MNDPLTALGEHYGTDKAIGHRYTPHYHQRFEALREEPITILEIGIGGYQKEIGGHSLRMWRDYFPKGTIVGLDIIDKSELAEDRVIIEQGDQSDPRDLHRIGKTHGPFDIIIDDGSHEVNDVIQSWVILWDYLKDGGWYCVEDIGTGYWPSYGGSSVSNLDSTIGFLQGLIDRINYAELDIPGYTVSRWDKTVVELDVIHNLAFIRRGDNTLPSLLMPPHPHSVTDGNIPVWRDGLIPISKKPYPDPDKAPTT